MPSPLEVQADNLGLKLQDHQDISFFFFECLYIIYIGVIYVTSAATGLHICFGVNAVQLSLPVAV